MHTQSEYPEDDWLALSGSSTFPSVAGSGR